MFSYGAGPLNLAGFDAVAGHPSMGRTLKVSDSRRQQSAQARGRSEAEARAERLLSRILKPDEAYARKVAAVRRYQKRLQGRLSARDWQLYLKLEEAEIGRWLHALGRVTQWALTPRRRTGQR